MVAADSVNAVRAAVVRQKGGPFIIETLQLEDPRADEVLVRIVSAGMCHTDMVVRDQVYPVPQPIVLGHEGAGIVEKVGSNVVKVQPGDHVVLTFMSCGRCRWCEPGRPNNCLDFNAHNFSGARADGTGSLRDERGPVHEHFFGQSSFSTFAVANERNVVKVRKDAPLELLGPLGCGIQTGAGAVMNALKVGHGASLAVFGAGAVGLSAVMAAHAVGATTIIAVDVVPSRLVLAKELGATDAVNAKECNPVEALRTISGGGVQFSLETTGLPEVVRQAVDALGVRGVCGIVGASPPGTDVRIDITDFMQMAKTMYGIIEGDSVPDVFIPQLLDLFLQGRFPFDKLAKFYPFDRINEAARDSEHGMTVKPIIRIGKA
jgi:aryl-alcohol dehydrogenase